MNERPDATPRRAMTPARRKRIWERDKGLCYMCSKAVPLVGTVMEHPIQLWMGGSDDDEDIHPICERCDLLKCAADASKRAKVKRIHARIDGTRKPRKQIASRGFDKSVTKGFDGKVRPRK